jgi:hypothetical protein
MVTIDFNLTVISLPMYQNWNAAPRLSVSRSVSLHSKSRTATLDFKLEIAAVS